MSGWQGFRLIPDDVLFFRDGKPSAIGADHYLRSLFPPLPPTLYGAIRTSRLLDEVKDLGSLNRETWSGLSVQLKEEIGGWGEFGTLDLRGPWLLRGKDILLPAPADLALVMRSETTLRGTDDQDRPECHHIMKVLRHRHSEDTDHKAIWSHQLKLAGPFELTDERWIPYDAAVSVSEPTSAEGWFLTSAGMEAWLAGKAPGPEQLVHASELWRTEPRTGVGLRSGSRTADSEAGMVYTFGFVRLGGSSRSGSDEIALGFEIRGGGISVPSVLRLGGEGRLARLEQGPAWSFPAPKHGAHRFLLYYCTPTISEVGAYPPGFAHGKVEGAIGGASCRLVGAFVRGTQVVGGWDMASAKAKPLRRAIPAGSVFVFERTNSDGESQLAGIHGQNICDYDTQKLSKQGFGLALIGVAN